MRATIEPRLSPDGRFYLEDPLCRPYALRSFYTLLARRIPFWAWDALGCTCLALTAAFVGLMCGSFWHSLLYLSLPIARQCVRFPVLTDQPALLCLALALYLHQPWIVLLGGVVNEKCAVFGSVFLASLWPLIALLLVAWGYGRGHKAKDGPEWLKQPVKAAWKARKRLLEPNVTVLPWGTALLGVGSLGPMEGLALLLGYLQLLTAQDGARLYQWACFGLIGHVQGPWLPLAAVMNWCNPYRDSV